MVFQMIRLLIGILFCLFDELRTRIFDPRIHPLKIRPLQRNHTTMFDVMLIIIVQPLCTSLQMLTPPKLPPAVYAMNYMVLIGDVDLRVRDQFQRGFFDCQIDVLAVLNGKICPFAVGSWAGFAVFLKKLKINAGRAVLYPGYLDIIPDAAISFC